MKSRTGSSKLARPFPRLTRLLYNLFHFLNSVQIKNRDDNRRVTLISGHHYEEVQAAMAGNQLVTSFEKSLCEGIDKGVYHKL